MKISPAQQALLDELSNGRVVVEDRWSQFDKTALKFDYELRYFTANVNEAVCAYGRPRNVLAATVNALLENGLIEETVLWPEHSKPIKAYKAIIKEIQNE